MSRRTGLGRGLAALIPPGDPTAPVGTREGPDLESGHLPGNQRDDGRHPDVGEDRGAPAAGWDPVAGDQDDAEVRVVHGSSTPSIPASTATYAEVPPGSISPNPRQPREVFDPDEIEGLATSLRDVGVLQPLVVRPAGDATYELIAGERRLRAALLAGLELVTVLVRHTLDADLLKEALVENIHRVQLNPLEEAAAYEQLLEEFGVTQEELATRLGRSRPAVSNALRLLRLPPAVQRRIAAGVLSAGHAKALLGVDDAALQSRLAERIVAEGLSVRATEELVRLRALDAPPPPRRRSAALTAPGLVDLQDDLSDALEARVRISMGARKGRLAIEFSSVDDLERIVGIIASGIGSSPPVPPTTSSPRDTAATTDVDHQER